MNNRLFYKQFFILMLPMALKELIATLINIVDTIMVGTLGEASIAAVGIGNQFYFLYNVFLFGISCGAGVFSAQFFGKKDEDNIRRILGLNLVLAAGIALIFTAVALFTPQLIFHTFNANEATLKEGISYLHLVSLGYVATAVTSAFDASLCATQKAGLPFLVRSIGLVINVLFNQLFIFGFGSIPAMGINGAALATVIARFSEMILILSVIYGKKMLQAANLSQLFSFSGSLVVQFLKTSSPVIFNEMAWSLGVFLYSWCYARISPDAMVIITIVQNLERLLMVFFHGGGNAGGVFVGKAVGEGDGEKAFLISKKLLFINFLFAFFLIAVCIPLRPLLLSPYSISPEIYAQCMNFLLVIILLSIVKPINFLLVVGIFRNGGDTKYSMLIDCGTVWLVGVPLALLSCLVLKLPLIWCYILVSMEETVKLILSLIHFKKKKWIKNVVENL